VIFHFLRRRGATIAQASPEDFRSDTDILTDAIDEGRLPLRGLQRRHTN
jgi:hypothetical protein